MKDTVRLKPVKTLRAKAGQCLHWKRKRALNDSTVTHRDQRYDKEETKAFRLMS